MPLNNPATAGPTHQTDVTATRTLGAVYQNTTGVTLYVSVQANCVTANAAEEARMIAATDSSNPPTTNVAASGYLSSVVSVSSMSESVFFPVLPGNYYKVTASVSGAATVTKGLWIEWY